MVAVAASRYDRRTHALQLAEAKGESVCSWHARAISMSLRDDGELLLAVWRIDSASSDAEYGVTYTAASDRAECCCAAAQRNRACWHSGLALMKGRYLAALYSPKGRVEAAAIAQRDAAYEGNVAALGF